MLVSFFVFVFWDPDLNLPKEAKVVEGAFMPRFHSKVLEEMFMN